MEIKEGRRAYWRVLADDKRRSLLTKLQSQIDDNDPSTWLINTFELRCMTEPYTGKGCSFTPEKGEDEYVCEEDLRNFVWSIINDIWAIHTDLLNSMNIKDADNKENKWKTRVLARFSRFTTGLLTYKPEKLSKNTYNLYRHDFLTIVTLFLSKLRQVELQQWIKKQRPGDTSKSWQFSSLRPNKSKYIIRVREMMLNSKFNSAHDELIKGFLNKDQTGGGEISRIEQEIILPDFNSQEFVDTRRTAFHANKSDKIIINKDSEDGEKTDSPWNFRKSMQSLIDCFEKDGSEANTLLWVNTLQKIEEAFDIQANKEFREWYQYNPNYKRSLMMFQFYHLIILIIFSLHSDLKTALHVTVAVYHRGVMDIKSEFEKRFIYSNQATIFNQNETLINQNKQILEGQQILYNKIEDLRDEVLELKKRENHSGRVIPEQEKSEIMRQVIDQRADDIIQAIPKVLTESIQRPDGNVPYPIAPIPTDRLLAKTFDSLTGQDHFTQGSDWINPAGGAQGIPYA